MKIVLFDDYRPGLLRDDVVVDLSSSVEIGRSGQETLQNIMADWDRLKPLFEAELVNGSTTPLASVELRAPVPWPSKILCMAANYREGTDLPARPLRAFVAPPTAILDPGGTVEFPAELEIRSSHHEAELVCVIGKQAKNVSETDALDYVFGYTAGCDISPRVDQWGFLSKSIDGHKPIGPCIVTVDEIDNPNNLRVRLSVDDVPRQDYNTSDMGHYVAECVAWFSNFITLLPGDILFLGTNHQQLGPIQDGETVKVDIDHIGILTFSVHDSLKRSWPKVFDTVVAEEVKEKLRRDAHLATSH